MWACGYFWNSLTTAFGSLHPSTTGLMRNKTIFRPSAKEGHSLPIRACIVIPGQRRLQCWEEKENKLIWHDKLDCPGLAAKHTPHFSLMLFCNRTTGGLGTFPHSSLAPTSKRGHSLRGECWQIPTFLSVLKLETFLENHYLPFIVLGRWAWEEWLQFAPGSALAALKTSDWSQIPRNKGDTASRWAPDGLSALKLQLWEETKTARELRNQSSALGTDQVLQEYENFANLVKKEKQKYCHSQGKLKKNSSN